MTREAAGFTFEPLEPGPTYSAWRVVRVTTLSEVCYLTKGLVTGKILLRDKIDGAALMDFKNEDEAEAFLRTVPVGKTAAEWLAEQESKQ